MLIILELITSPIVISLLSAIIVAQSIKIIILIIKKKKISLLDIFSSGDMPSGHTAIVSALTMILFLIEGLSTGFFVSFIFLCVVIRDALGVRKTTGENTQRINKIIQKQKLNIPLKDGANGHTYLEVIIGAIIGVLSALIVYIIMYI